MVCEASPGTGSEFAATFPLGIRSEQLLYPIKCLPTMELACKPQPKSKMVSFFFHFLRLEEGSADLRKRMSRLEEELDQEKKKYTMLEIKLRNSERAREDAEKRNQLLQREMEEFFSTLGSLTVGAKGARALK